MKLVVLHFREVGIGSLVEFHPLGQWLGLNIPPLSVEFVLLRPSSIVLDLENLFREPRESDYRILRDVINWTIL